MDENNQRSTKTSGISKDELDYSEELKLNIVCDEEGSHVAVLYCTFCKTNLCRECTDRVHSLKSLSAHQIVRLTKKPEPPIMCSIHQLKKAELICKEPSCDGIDNPMCTMCHHNGIHRGHSCKVIDYEYDKILENIAGCSEEIEGKQAICDKNIEEYDKCISTYSNKFMQTQRDKIESFYSEAKTSALETFENFANNRVGKLKMLKNQYVEERMKLDSMNLEVRKIKEMKKLEMLENGGAVEELMRQAAEKKNDESTELIPSDCYTLTFPSSLAIDIQKGSSDEMTKTNGEAGNSLRYVPEFQVKEEVVPEMPMPIVVGKKKVIILTDSSDEESPEEEVKLPKKKGGRPRKGSRENDKRHEMVPRSSRLDRSRQRVSKSRKY